MSFDGLGASVFADDRVQAQRAHPFDRPEHAGASVHDGWTDELSQRVTRRDEWRTPGGTRRALGPVVGLTALTVALLTAVGPTALWRHSGIGAGRAIDTIVSPNQLRSWSNGARRSIIWEGDGRESSVALAIQPSGYAFIVNGKSDGSVRGDTSTMIMTGLLGALLGHPPRRSQSRPTPPPRSRCARRGG